MPLVNSSVDQSFTKPSYQDIRFAAATLRLGVRNIGLTKPNPCVSAIIVGSSHGHSIVVGRGVTAPGGRPHAETLALNQAGIKARGATLYVTLEPCSHFGQTPPCVDAIVEAGISRVVVCTADPDERVSGAGLIALRNAGIEVVTPVLESEALRFHASYMMPKLTDRPFVFLKMAVSADGMIGQKDMGQIAISGPEAWHYVQQLRMQSDSILVGVGTVICDDPALTCRLPGLEHRSPLRVVLDSKEQMPQSARLLHSDPQNTLIMKDRKPADVLSALFERGIQSVMIEGGARVATSFLQAGLVDAVHLIKSDIQIGEGGVAAPLELMVNPTRFHEVDSRRLGVDNLTIHWRKDFACSPE